MQCDLDRVFRCCQRNRDIPSLERLVPSKVDPNATIPTARLRSITRRSVPLLCVASACGSLDAVRLLVRAGARLDSADSFGSTAVDWASFSGHSSVLSFLIDNGGKSQVTQRGIPLLQATRYNRLDCVNCLISAGAPVATTDIAGRTPLHLACWFGHVEVAKSLLSAGTPADLPDPQLRTPLHYCAWFGNSEIIPLLVERRVAVNAVDKSQDTPLHFACKHSRGDAVSALLRAGADPKMKNAEGFTPEDFAEKKDNREILELLQKREKPPRSDDAFLIAAIREQKEMGRMLEAITTHQEMQTTKVGSLKATVDLQWSTLQDLADGYGVLGKDLSELEAAAVHIRGALLAKEVRQRLRGPAATTRQNTGAKRANEETPKFA